MPRSIPGDRRRSWPRGRRPQLVLDGEIVAVDERGRAVVPAVAAAARTCSESRTSDGRRRRSRCTTTSSTCCTRSGYDLRGAPLTRTEGAAAAVVLHGDRSCAARSALRRGRRGGVRGGVGARAGGRHREAAGQHLRIGPAVAQLAEDQGDAGGGVRRRRATPAVRAGGRTRSARCSWAVRRRREAACTRGTWAPGSTTGRCGR